MIEAPVTLLRQHVYEGDSNKGKRTNVSLCLYRRKNILLLGISKYVTKIFKYAPRKYIDADDSLPRNFDFPYVFVLFTFHLSYPTPFFIS
jgi:hypothetical protein